MGWTPSELEIVYGESTLRVFPALIPHPARQRISKSSPQSLQTLRQHKELRPDSPILSKLKPRVRQHFLQQIGHEIALIDALAADTRMNSVWTSLARQRQQWQPVEDKPLLCKYPVQDQFTDLYDHCLRIVGDFQKARKRTPAENRKHYKKLAADTKTLAGRLRNEHDTEYVFREDSTESVKTGSSFTTRSSPDTGLSLSDILGNEAALRSLRPPENGFMPDVPQLLLQIASAAAAEANKPIEVPQPKSTTAARRFFVRRLSDYFLRTYGHPLHEHVATITNTITGSDDVDPDAVRSLVSSKR